MRDDVDPFADEESDTICRHWGGASECQKRCAECGELCGEHDDWMCDWTEEG